MNAPRWSRWLFRFGLKSLLVLMAAVCLILGYAKKTSRDRTDAIRAIQELGGRVSFAGGSEDVQRVPSVLRNWLGDDYFRRVEWIDLLGPKFGDENIHLIKPLSEARRFSSYHSRITDEGMQQLESLHDLEEFYVTSLKITDAGLRHLEGLKRLKRVQIWACSLDVTNDGKEALVRALPQLRPARNYTADAGTIRLGN